MRRRLISMLVTVMVAGGMVVGFAPGANATRIITRYQGSTVSLKYDCQAQGGTYFESPSGRVGVCVRKDGTIMTCDDGQPGQNCNIQGRVITEDDEFLDLIRTGLAAPDNLSVAPGDGSATKGGKKEVRELLEQPTFVMPLVELGSLCGERLGADLVTSADGNASVCLADSVTVFCNTDDGESCAIEKVKKSTRKWLRLLRKAFLDPSSVEIVLPAEETPPATSRSTSPTAPTSTSTSTTTTTEPGPSIL